MIFLGIRLNSLPVIACFFEFFTLRRRDIYDDNDYDDDNKMIGDDDTDDVG